MDAIKIMKGIHLYLFNLLDKLLCYIIFCIDIYNLSAEDKKNDFSKNLEVMLKDILKRAHKIYDQDLVAKDKADTIRNSLHILDTYKSLIYFPPPSIREESDFKNDRKCQKAQKLVNFE